MSAASMRPDARTTPKTAFDIDDARLLVLATERMSRFDPKAAISEGEMDREFPIAQEQLDAVGEIGFE